MKPRLVVDTSIACWSAELPGRAPSRDKRWRVECIALMECILNNGFLLAMSDELFGEVNDQLFNDKNPKTRNRAYGRKWILAMEKSGRIPDLTVPAEHHFRPTEAVEMTAAMAKDAHLVESALSSDLVILARDGPVLNDWIEYCHRDPLPRVIASHWRIPSIVWADPGIHGHDVVVWLKSSTPVRGSWTIGTQTRHKW